MTPYTDVDTRGHNLEDRDLKLHRHENLKSHIDPVQKGF